MNGERRKHSNRPKTVQQNIEDEETRGRVVMAGRGKL